MPELTPSANTSVNQLSQFIERIERLEEEKSAGLIEKFSQNRTFYYQVTERLLG